MLELKEKTMDVIGTSLPCGDVHILTSSEARVGKTAPFKPSTRTA